MGIYVLTKKEGKHLTKSKHEKCPFSPTTQRREYNKWIYENVTRPKLVKHGEIKYPDKRK